MKGRRLQRAMLHEHGKRARRKGAAFGAAAGLRIVNQRDGDFD